MCKILKKEPYIYAGEFSQKKNLTSFQMIILGFAGVILLGTLLLMLPVSSADGIVTPFDEALFTSTSAERSPSERNGACPSLTLF